MLFCAAAVHARRNARRRRLDSVDTHHVDPEQRLRSHPRDPRERRPVLQVVRSGVRLGVPPVRIADGVASVEDGASLS